MLIAAGKRICESGWGEEELYGSHPLEFAETEITLVPYAYWGNQGKRRDGSVVEGVSV